MKATNIQWDIDMDEVYEVLDEMTAKNAAEALDLPYDRYANMTTGERHDYAYDYFRHRPGALDEFMGLPKEVDPDWRSVDLLCVCDYSQAVFLSFLCGEAGVSGNQGNVSPD